MGEQSKKQIVSWFRKSKKLIGISSANDARPLRDLGFQELIRKQLGISEDLASRKPPVDKENFCRRCRQLDLDELFSMEITTGFSKFIIDLNASKEELECSDCALCRLFGSMGPMDSPKNNTNYQLRAYSTYQAFSIARETDTKIIYENSTLLGVVRNDHTETTRAAHNDTISLRSTGYIYSTRSNQRRLKLQPRLISPSMVDLNFVQRNIEYCRMNHGAVCNITSFKSVVGVKLIDCKTQTIVAARSNHKYVALSYVWGTCTTIGLDDAPKVVKDSIDMTRKLGFRYLWVDRYCINQMDDVDKQIQIDQMNLIYQKAEVTIIAAAGSDSHHGLAGVNGTLRKEQPYLNLGDHSIISTLRSFENTIVDSKWATRGWTYQEGVFSRRRLVFTEEQVMFECNGVQCCESLLQDLESTHVDEKRKYEGGYSEDPSHYWKFPKGFRARDADLMHYISEFSRRQLTFSEDTLHAMQGIFNEYSSGKFPIYQFFGVVISPNRFSATEMTPAEFFLFGLWWYHDISEPAERTGAFPSWSWAGWKGQVMDRFMIDNDSYDLRLDNTIQVWKEADDGTCISFPDWASLPEFLGRQAQFKNQFIKIEATAVELCVVYLSKTIEHGDLAGYYARVKVEEDTSAYAKLYLDRNNEYMKRLVASKDRRTKGILISEKVTGWYNNVVIVVEEMEEHVERIGIFSLQSCKYLSRGDGWIYKYDDAVRNWILKENKPRQMFRLG